jgi:hypothetical protein
VSNHLISTAYKRDLRTPMRKSVMALLADKASDDGSGIYASKQTMADELCCSKQTIIDTIKGFLLDGLVVELGKRRAPNGFTVEYGIVVAQLEALPLVKCHADRAARQSTRLTGQSAGPVSDMDRSTSLTPPVQQVDPNPPEPSSSKASPSSNWGRKALESFRSWAANAEDKDGIGRKLNWQQAWAKWIIEQDNRDGQRNEQRVGGNGRGASPSGRGPTVDAATRFLARRGLAEPV